MHKMIKYRLYFGRNVAGESPVTNDQIKQFLFDTVNPHFTCYSVFHGTGVWNGTTENTFVLEFIVDLAPYGMNKEPDLQEIADGYKVRFSQESVMITKEFVEVSF